MVIFIIYLWFLMITNQLVRWLHKSSDPSGYLKVNGYGIFEKLPEKEINRPVGTGDYLLMCFHSGAKTIIEDKPIIIHEPFTMLWVPKAKQFYEPLQFGDKHSWVHFNGLFIDNLLKELNISVNNRQPVDIELQLNFLNLLHVECDQQADTLVLQSLFTFLFRKISKLSRSRDLSESSIPENIVKVQNFMDQNFSSSLFLKDLAKMSNYSVPHFCMLFRNYYGVSPIQYITRQRIEKAKYMLGNVNYNVGEISEALGYQDIFQFSRIFKSYTNNSPLQYRKNLLGKK